MTAHEYLVEQFDEARRWLRIKTSLEDENAVFIRSIQGQEAMSQLFEYQVDLLSTADFIDIDKIVGKPATVTMQIVDDDPDALRYFHGHIRSLSYLGHGDQAELYRATIVPWPWFLTRNSDCRIFQGLTIPEIIRRIFKAHGFKDYDDKGLGSYPKEEYRVQYRETDFNFISRLMEEAGIFYYFRHEKNRHVMVLGDNKSAYDQCHEKEVNYLSKAGTDEISDKITSWEHRYDFVTGKTAHTDYNFKTPRTSLAANSQTMVKLGDAKKYEFYDYPGTYPDRGVGKTLADVRMEEEEQNFEVIFGAGKCRSFDPGHKFTLKRHHAQCESNKTYVLTSVHHKAELAGDFVSGGEATGLDYENAFTCIPDKLDFRPPRRTQKPVVQGIQTATVTGEKGEIDPRKAGREIYTDDHARIRVLFHWDRRQDDEEAKKDSSCWMRVAQPTAGSGWGTVAIPRIGHEVVIHFLDGDPDRPLVMGCVYNEVNPPPVSNAGRDSAPPEKTPQADMMTTIKSNSLGYSGGFNEITMNDTGEKEGLYIKAQKDEIHHVLNDRKDNVDNDETITIGRDRTEEVGRDEKITIGNDRTEEVGNDETITIKNDRTETVVNNEDITIGVNRTEKVGVNETVTIGAKQTINVGANKSETVAAMSTESVGLAKMFSTGAAYQVNVGAAMNETVVGAKMEEVGGYRMAKVGGDNDVTVSGDSKLEVSGSHTGTAQTIELTGSTKIVLSCGASTIEMTPGSITIKAPMVKINC